MPEPESPNPKSRAVRRIAGIIFCAAGAVVLWMQVGPRWFCFYVGAILLIEAIRFFGRTIVRRCVSSSEEWPNEGAVKERSRLLGQFVVASLYLALISLVLTDLTERSFYLVFGAVITGTVFTGSLILVWAASRTLRDDSHQSQFSILTLLFLTTILAIYLSAICWLVDLAGERLQSGIGFLGAAEICLWLTLVSLPCLLLYTENLVWTAAWFVRRPWVQRWFRRQ